MNTAPQKREQAKSEPAVADPGKGHPPIARHPMWPLTLSVAYSPAVRLDHGFGSNRPSAPPLMQPKLTVGTPGDQYEQEADRVADMVMRMPEPAIRLQRKCGCASSGKLCSECDEGQSLVQRFAHPGATAQSETQSGAKLSGAFGPAAASTGQPVDAATRSFMEPRLGHDLSEVRIHNDAESAQLAHSVGAVAFTTGHHIMFGSGQYAPETHDGRKLLAHELAHVIQQSRNPGLSSTIQRSLFVSNAGARPNFGVRDFRRQTRAQIVASWLNTLCPAAGWRVDPTSGQVSTPNPEFCARFESVTGSVFTPFSASCDCVCQAVVLDEERVDLFVESRIGLREASPGTMPERRLEVVGGAETFFPERGARFEVENPTIVMSGRGGNLRGAGDAGQAGMVRTPPWLVLAHELCGHVQMDWRTDRVAGTHWQTPQGNRTAIDIENLIRREHGLGTRRGGGFTGLTEDSSVYQLQAGETLADLEDRFGIVLTGRAAWALNLASGGDRGARFGIPHRSLINIGGEGPEITEAQLNSGAGDAAAQAALDRARSVNAGEIAIVGIAWDVVHSADSWASIAQRWRVRPRPGRSAAQRVERANRGIVTSLDANSRVVIPPR